MITENNISKNLISSPTNILTIHDVILDSPTWRANVSHLEDQIDHFDKWLDGFIRALKNYIDALSKFTAQTSNLGKKTFLGSGFEDGSLIDDKVTGNIITRFASILESSIAHKTKLTSELESGLLAPLQKLQKSDMKIFKDNRKQYEKMLDKYEAQLNRYYALSKQKEASALREDTFQMYDLRKQYVRLSNEHFIKLITFKAHLEDILVTCFTCALSSHLEDVDASLVDFESVRLRLDGWQRWLDESKRTVEYQLHRISQRCEALQTIYLNKLQPQRSLKRYSNSQQEQQTDEPDDQRRKRKKSGGTSFEKQGYLCSRIISNTGKSSRPAWVRKWFFIQDGWFGTCNATAIQKVRGCIVLNDLLQLDKNNKNDVITCRVYTETDRRFCFELVHPKCTYYLQAETEEDMQQWIETLEANINATTTPTLTNNTDSNTTNDNNTTENSNPLASRELPLPPSNSLNTTSSTAGNSSIVAMTSSPLPASPNDTEQENEDYCFTTTSSLTSLLLREGKPSPSSLSTSSSLNYLQEQQQQQQQQERQASSNKRVFHYSSSQSSLHQNLQQNSAWGWFTTSMNIAFTNTNNTPDSNINNTNTAQTATDDAMNHSHSSASLSQQQNDVSDLIVWPTKIETDILKPSLADYSSRLEAGQKELRRLFWNVPKDEVVLETFIGSLYRQQRLQQQLSESNVDNGSSDTVAAYGYSGVGFITQKALWFYSRVLMASVNMIVIPLEKIASVRYVNGSLLIIETQNREHTFSFGFWLENRDLIYEKLKYMTQHHRQTDDLQTIYDHLCRLDKKVPVKITNKNRLSSITTTNIPTSHVTTSSSALYSLTPVTVQAQPATPIMKINNSSSTSTRNSLETVASSTATISDQQQQQPADDNSSIHSEAITDIAQQRGSPAQGALLAAMKSTAALRSSANAAASLNTNATTTNMNNNVENDIDGTLTSTARNTVVDEWPEGLSKPSEPVTCSCSDHLEKVETDIELPVSAHRLFRILFNHVDPPVDANDQKLWAELNKSRGYGEPTFSTWVPTDDEQKTQKEKEQQHYRRTMNYIMPVSNPLVKAKETPVEEAQEIIESRPHTCYVVEVTTKTPQLPYADAFTPCIKYCITFMDSQRCRLKCSMGVRWLKTIFVKGMVNRAATKGMQETIQGVIPLIQKEVQQEITSRQQQLQQKTQLEASSTTNAAAAAAADAQREKQIAASAPKPVMDSKAIGTARWAHILTILFGCICLACTALNIFMQLNFKGQPVPLSKHRVVEEPISWHGVYLRDLMEHGFTTSDGEQQLVRQPHNSSMYHQFKAAARQSDSIYPWFSKEHHWMSTELSMVQGKLGLLRYELLTLFRMVNRMDSQVLDYEYYNWVSNQRFLCKQRKKQKSKKSGWIKKGNIDSDDADTLRMTEKYDINCDAVMNEQIPL